MSWSSATGTLAITEHECLVPFPFLRGRDKRTIRLPLLPPLLRGVGRAALARIVLVVAMIALCALQPFAHRGFRRSRPATDNGVKPSQPSEKVDFQPSFASYLT